MTHDATAHLSLPAPPRHRCRGFSLMEMLVVLALVAMLVGFFLAWGGVARDTAQAAKTRNIMQNGESLSSAFWVETDTVVNHSAGLGTQPFNWGNSWRTNNPDMPVTTKRVKDSDFGPENYTQYIERFVVAMGRTRATENMLKPVQLNLRDTDRDGFMEIVDGWGRPLVYASQVLHAKSGPQDPDDFDPDDNFLPEFPEPFFASAGPDGKWGHVEDDPDGSELNDNVYSTSLEGE